MSKAINKPVNTIPPPPKDQQLAYDNSFGDKLKELMESVLDRKEWTFFLEVNKSTLSHWFKNRHIPSSEHIYKIQELVNDVGDAKAKQKLKELYRTPLVHITPKYASFKVDTLNEYCTEILLERIMLNLRTDPAERTIAYYEQVAQVLNIFSTFQAEERTTFIHFLKDLYRSADFKQMLVKGFHAIYENLQRLTYPPLTSLKSISAAIDNTEGFTVWKNGDLEKVFSKIPNLEKSRIRLETFFFKKDKSA